MNELYLILFFAFLLSGWAILDTIAKKKSSRKDDTVPESEDGYEANYSSFEHNSISGYKRMDVNFSESDFEENAREVFLGFCDAVKKGKPSLMKPFFEPEYYKKINTIKREYEKYKFDFNRKFEVVDLHISGWRRIGGKDYMKVRIRVRNQNMKFILEWIFEREEDSTTDSFIGETSRKCPNCGASLDFSGVTRCSHCRAFVKSSGFDWLVSNTEVIFEKDRK